MGIAAAKGLGIKMIGIGPKDLIDGVEQLVLGILWQLIRMWVSMSINLKDTPEIIKLAFDGEDPRAVFKL